MGIGSEELRQLTGLRHRSYMHVLLQQDNLIAAALNHPVGNWIARTSFGGGVGGAGFRAGTLRTKTVTLITGVGGTDRNVKVEMLIRSPSGEVRQEIVSLPTTAASSTSRAESYYPGWLVAYRLMPGGNFQAVDTLQIGERWSSTAPGVTYFANVIFGLDLDVSGARRDANGLIVIDGDNLQTAFALVSAAGATFTVAGVALAAENMRYDEGRKGYKLTTNGAPLTNATDVNFLVTEWTHLLVP